MFEVHSPHYSGPLHKLLELIEEKKLEITTISLAEVTGDFLEYIKKLGEHNEPRILADFLVVAARLILIKSKALLPTLALSDEEERDIHDLEARLRLYREYCAIGASASGGKTAHAHMQKLWERRAVARGRELFSGMGSAGVFYPGKNTTSSALSETALRLAALIKNFLPESREIKIAIATLEEKIEELLARVTAAAEKSFHSLAAGKSKIEAILLFVALLHLLKDKLVNVTQKERFGDIMIMKHEA